MQRTRQGTLLMAALLAVAACDAKKDAAKPETAKAEAGDTKAQAGDADTEDTETPEAEEAEKSEDEKKAERIERIKKEFAELEAWKATELARWTEEVTTAAKELIAKDFESPEDAIAAFVASPHRHADNRARDAHRHPVETLSFFGVTPGMTVVEVGPGRGWYTEILAPMLAAGGKLVVNSPNPEGAEDDTGRIYGQRIHTFLATSPEAYGKVEVIVPSEPEAFEIGPEGSADMVLVIRGLHGVARDGKLAERLAVMHRTLKAGGVLGVVQHRAKADADPMEAAKAGYLPEQWLIEQIEAAGFELQEKSEINANPADTKDHPNGVWSLPPSLSGDDADKAKFAAIGESDRMTLRFVKKAG